MKNLLLITIISIISTGRRIGSPLIFIKLLWWAPRRGRVMCLLSPWRKGVIISPPWSRWVWSVFFKKKEREKKNKKVKGFMDHSSRALMSAKHTLTEDGPESVESGNGNETALYERWNDVSNLILQQKELGNLNLQKKPFIGMETILRFALFKIERHFTLHVGGRGIWYTLY